MSAHCGVKQAVIKRQVTWKFLTFAVKLACRNNLREKEEPTMENRKYFELNNNENTVFSNLLFVFKGKLRPWMPMTTTKKAKLSMFYTHTHTHLKRLQNEN